MKSFATFVSGTGKSNGIRIRLREIVTEGIRDDHVRFYLTTEAQSHREGEKVALHCKGNEEQTTVDSPSGNRRL